MTPRSKLTVNFSSFLDESSYLIFITQDGDSALIKAAYYGETDVVVELVKGGANLDLQNEVCIVMNTGYPRCSAIVIIVVAT